MLIELNFNQVGFFTRQISSTALHFRRIDLWCLLLRLNLFELF